ALPSPFADPGAWLRLEIESLHRLSSCLRVYRIDRWRQPPNLRCHPLEVVRGAHQKFYRHTKLAEERILIMGKLSAAIDVATAVQTHRQIRGHKKVRADAEHTFDGELGRGVLPADVGALHAQRAQTGG